MKVTTFQGLLGIAAGATLIAVVIWGPHHPGTSPGTSIRLIGLALMAWAWALVKIAGSEKKKEKE